MDRGRTKDTAECTPKCIYAPLAYANQTFEPLKREAESASLDDEDFEFTGKKLQAFTFRGIRHTVNTWKEMLIQVCGYILIDKRSTIEWLCANEKPGFSTSPEE